MHGAKQVEEKETEEEMEDAAANEYNGGVCVSVCVEVIRLSGDKDKYIVSSLLFPGLIRMCYMRGSQIRTHI